MFGLLLPMAGGAGAPAAVPAESGAGRRRALRRVSRSRVILQMALAAPTVTVRGWAAPPPHASLAVRWSSPLVEINGRSVPTFRAQVRGTVTITVRSEVRMRAEPPTVELSGAELLIIADQFLND